MLLAKEQNPSFKAYTVSHKYKVDQRVHIMNTGGGSRFVVPPDAAKGRAGAIVELLVMAGKPTGANMAEIADYCYKVAIDEGDTEFIHEDWIEPEA